MKGTNRIMIFLVEVGAGNPCEEEPAAGSWLENSWEASL